MSKSNANPELDGYFTRAKKWREEMEALRRIALGCGLTEELKWGKPCYTYEGANLVLIIGFKNYCSLLFCKGALLQDPEGILIKPGENTQAARQARFTDAATITRLTPALKGYLCQAVEAEKAGLEVTYKKPSEFTAPAELEAKFKKDAAFKKAFTALTPGRQRAYVMHFAAAKQAATREARIEKYVPLILAGKGMSDEYRQGKK